MTPIPPTFSFSQSSLQAYEECARRFWLAYIEQLPWPAVEASPFEEHEAAMQLGERFHRLVQRAEIGIDPGVIASGLEPPLSTWFAAYRTHRPADLPQEFVEIECVLSVMVDAESAAQAMRYRLAAKYDLIAVDLGGRAVILDWKTSRRRADPARLRQRWQSIVYPYVLVEASVNLPWGPLRPEQVEMHYWFTAEPDHPVIFRYDAAQHDAAHRRLQRLLAEILAGEQEADFPRVSDTPANRRRLCAFCVYRSRCNRGESAGDIDELDGAEEFFAVDLERALEFTLDDVEELAF